MVIRKGNEISCARDKVTSYAFLTCLSALRSHLMPRLSTGGGAKQGGEATEWGEGVGGGNLLSTVEGAFFNFLFVYQNALFCTLKCHYQV